MSGSYLNKQKNEILNQMEYRLSVINEELGGVKIEMAKIKKDLCWLKKEFEESKTVLSKIENSLNRRPTWLFSLVIGALLSIMTGLIVFLLTD